ncbi:MAG: DUF4906 domain-containing protein [Bacteroidales bacterium]|nr:DUF4906 domain-containing protein [Bacteroidales bacterium]
MKQEILLAGVLSLALLGACKQETDLPEKQVREEAMVQCCFDLSAGDEWIPSTKSTLTSANIETRVGEVVLAVYRDGRRFSSVWFKAPFRPVPIPLYQGQRFHVYALANMGDMRDVLPVEESKMADFTYRISAYHDGSASSVDKRGIPMAGFLDYWARDGISTQIRLYRLLARVNVNLECQWPGGRITHAAVKNMNRTLKPFGDSAIASADDLYDGAPEAETVGGDGRSVQLVLYVPENLQGVIPGIESALEKSQDYNQDVQEKKDRLTYLEVSVTGSGLYEGSMTYRNYLGNNATDSFDIERDKGYVWNISYYEDNLYRDEWKYENSLEDMRSLTMDDTIMVCAGDTLSLGDYLNSNIPPETLCWESQDLADGESDLIQKVLNQNNLAEPSLVIKGTVTPGQQMRVSIQPQNNAVSRLCQTCVLKVVNPLELEFQKVGTGPWFPYQKVSFAGIAHYANSADAYSILAGIEVEPGSQDLISAAQEMKVCQDDEGYYLQLTLAPGKPGFYTCQISNSRGSNTLSFSADEPVLISSTEQLHIDLTGTEKVLQWRLTDGDSHTVSAQVAQSDCRFTLNLEDPNGTDLSFVTSSTAYAPFQRYNVMLKSFRGLDGLDSYQYTFQGLTLPLRGTFTYPNGYAVSHDISVVIDNPLSTVFDGRIGAIRVDMGASQSDDNVSASPEYYPDYMLDWPARTMTVDLTQGGTRTVPANLEKWTGQVCQLTPGNYSLSGGNLSFPESLSQWGPLYLGKTITNSNSHEQFKLPHTIVRIYDHYNVFAAFDVQQSNTGMMQQVWGSMNWNFPNGREWGCFKASWKANFSKGPYSSILNQLVNRTCDKNTAPSPIYTGFYKTDDIPNGEAGNYYYRTNGISGYNGCAEYYIGYWNEDSGYDIYYRLPHVTDWDFLDIRWDIVNWRVIAAANSPQFGIGSGGFSYNNLYCGTVTHLTTGSYNFSIMSKADYENHRQDLYLDHLGRGYQFVHPFWEGKGALYYVQTKKLNAGKWPESRPYVYLLGGWYDPSLYYNAETPSQNGVPLGGNQVGMYLYDTSNPYYPEDHPTNFREFNATDINCMDAYNTGIYHTYLPKNKYRNGIEWFSFGTLRQRDVNAAR